MKILFDNVIKNAQHIYDWGELESVDLERMRGIIEVLNDCKKQGEQLEQAEKAFEEINYQFELHEHDIINDGIKRADVIATEALQAIRK